MVRHGDTPRGYRLCGLGETEKEENNESKREYQICYGWERLEASEGWGVPYSPWTAVDLHNEWTSLQIHDFITYTAHISINKNILIPY